jgi:hypothetical protein
MSLYVFLLPSSSHTFYFPHFYFPLFRYFFSPDFLLPIPLAFLLCLPFPQAPSPFTFSVLYLYVSSFFILSPPLPFSLFTFLLADFSLPSVFLPYQPVILFSPRSRLPFLSPSPSLFQSFSFVTVVYLFSSLRFSLRISLSASVVDPAPVGPENF